MKYHPSDSVAVILIAALIVASHSSSQGLSILEIIIGITPIVALIWILVRSINKSGLVWRVGLPRGIILLLLFFSWAFLTVVPALSSGVEFIEWMRRFMPITLLSLFAFVTTVVFRSKSRVHVGTYFLLLICLCGVLLSLLNAGPLLLDFAAHPQRLRKYGGGYFGPVVFTLALGTLFGPQSRSHFIISLCGLIVGFVGVTISYTRTYWVSTAVAAFVMVILWAKISEVNRKSTSKISIIIFVSTLILIIVGISSSGAFAQRLLSILTPLDSLSFQDRIFELHGLLTASFSDPVRLIVGQGFGAKFSFFSVNPFSWGGKGYVSISYSHNYYAYLLWTTGVVGLSLFAIVLRDAFVSGLYALSSSQLLEIRGAVLGLIGILINVVVASLTAPMLPKIRWTALFGIVLGLLFTTCYLIGEGDCT